NRLEERFVEIESDRRSRDQDLPVHRERHAHPVAFNERCERMGVRLEVVGGAADEEAGACGLRAKEKGGVPRDDSLAELAVDPCSPRIRQAVEAELDAPGLAPAAPGCRETDGILDPPPGLVDDREWQATICIAMRRGVHPIALPVCP